MKIEIWSDFVCPFCYIGKANLQQALSELSTVGVDIVWRSFELDATYPQNTPSGHYDLLQQKYQLSREAAEAKCQQLAAVGASCGLNMDFAHAQYSNTFLAHQLQHYAHSVSDAAATAINAALFAASFEQGRDIGNMDTLVEIGVENGLDGGACRLALQQNAFATAVRIDETAAQELQITGVPFFGFDGRLAVAGAQSIDAFKEVIQHILQHDAAEDAKLLRH